MINLINQQRQIKICFAKAQFENYIIVHLIQLCKTLRLVKASITIPR